MSRRQRRNIVACGNCGANFDASGADPRCPACNERLADFEPQAPRPAVQGYSTDLEGPDLLRGQSDSSETAPVEEFVAAGFVFIAFVTMVASIGMRSPLGLQLGMAMFAVTGIGFGLFKVYRFVTGKEKRREDAFSDQPSMLEWLVGRGFWDRWR